MAKGTSINDSVHGLVHMSAYEKVIISTPGFNRLHDVYQNSTVYLTFPSNRTKRYEHSIGTMKLCSDMFYHSVLNARAEELERFFACGERHIEKIIEDINADRLPFDCGTYFGGKNDFCIESLKELEFDEVRRSFVPSNVPDRYVNIQIVLMESVRTAALLHDIGHPPFSHIVEFALKGTYEDVDAKRRAGGSLTVREREFLSSLDSCFGGNTKKLHERMGDIITENVLESNVRHCSDGGNGRLLTENLFAAIVYRCVLDMFGEKPFFSSLHRIMDSTVDGDRLDYTTRDSINSGLDVGKIDYNRIIPDMRLYYIPDSDEPCEDSRFYFCFPIKSVSTIEDFLRRRYNLYKDIIFHHHVTKTDYLLQSTVRKFARDYLTSPEECTSAEADELIPFDISGLWHPLRPKERSGREKTKDNLVQWNDSWLMTMLKQIYYRDYFGSSEEKGRENFITSRQLSELLLNEKVYFSLTKRSVNFQIIDDAVRKGLQQDEGAKGFITPMIMKEYDKKGGESFLSLVKRCVIDSAEKIYGQNQVEDVIVAPVSLSAGIDPKRPVYFYSDNGDSTFPCLSDVSGIGDILDFELKHVPPFYIYVMLYSPELNTPETEKRFLTEVGEKLARNIKNYT